MPGQDPVGEITTITLNTVKGMTKKAQFHYSHIVVLVYYYPVAAYKNKVQKQDEKYASFTYSNESNQIQMLRRTLLGKLNTW